MRLIKPKNNNGSILIRFMYQSRDYCISQIGTFGNPNDMRIAGMICSSIMFDIEDRQFDQTLERYKAMCPKSKTEKIRMTRKTVQQCFDDYINHQSKHLASNTIKGQYQRCKNLIARCLHAKFQNAKNILEFIQLNTTIDGYIKTSNLLIQMNEWLIENKQIDRNYFAEFKARKDKRLASQIEKRDSFTESERDAIINACIASDTYRHYAPLIEFLFYTGCRPSEALALTWKNIDDKNICFRNVVNRDGTIKTTLKTQKQRSIAINDRIAEILVSANELLEYDNPIVFPSKNGRLLNWQYFSDDVWPKILEIANVRYRKPYSMRHTFITLAIKTGYSATIISKLVGNSTRMIENHYLGDVSDIKIELD